MGDISVDKDGFRVNIRVAALLANEDSILMTQLYGSDFWFLPGGRVATGETFQEALRRELLEELGDHFEIGPLALLCENFFTYEGLRFHELCAFFEAWQGATFDNDMSRLSDERFHYRWIKRSELGLVNVKPEFLATELMTPTSPFTHIVIKNGRRV